MASHSSPRVPQPLVSVIIPIHNGERYLSEAVDSVLAQTFSSLELVAVDDSSTDASARIVQAYGDRVRYVRREFHNTARTRNEGAALAHGDYLAFLDQDDVWLADKLELQMEEFRAHPQTDAVFGQVVQFRQDSEDVHPDWAQMQGYTPSVMLVKRAAFERVGPFDPALQIGEWVDWYARARDLKLNMARLPHMVARRRLHAENKGVVQRTARAEYARVLKASLDRRRASEE